LWDVYTAVDDPGYREDRCYHKNTAGCEQEKRCRVKHIWFKFGRTLKKTMTGITLMEITKNQQARK
jgi:DNA-binding IscR family transcriptional regulator